MEKPLFIDTHAHLDDARYDADREAVVQRAKDAGLKNVITIGCWNAKRGFDGPLSIVRDNAFAYLSLGVHPHEAGQVGDDVFALIRRLALDEANRVVALGETGLDYHYEHSPRDKQKAVFIKHIRLGRELNLPLIIHSREADKDTMEILESEGASSIGGVFHCFSGDASIARKALDIGFYLSFAGIITFPKADAVREVVQTVPIERMLIETDCPYLAPSPHRGKRNEPAFVVRTAQEIAKIKKMSVADVARITTANAEGVFGLEKREAIKIAYPIRNSLYLNVTNRCSNHCSFCAKFKSYTVKGHYLRLKEEPSFEEVLKAIGDNPLKYDEIVFCGFGEPLLRLDLVKKIGLHLKKMGCRIRIDTDGLANLVHNRNILPELGFVDVISVSLNAPDSAAYQRLIKTPFGEAAYPAILFFLREAGKHIAKVVASVVAVPGLDVEACRKVAEDELGVAFRVREYDNVG
ncbi:MAG: YchF/TatD family DNA exonuclease [Deltaproteobacteria bacterium]|nr:YchF/TatD family DNA exonuclease [Deltaproteobacteria bacterium]